MKICFCRDQKAIDIENRANYMALKQRWEVLDATILIPDDEMVKNVPPYMEDSEDEDDMNSNLSPSHTVDSEEQLTGVCNNIGDSTVSESPDCQSKDPESAVAVCSYCTNPTNCDSGNCSLGESTDSAISDTQRTSSAAPAASSRFSGQNESPQMNQSTLKDKVTEVCEHLNGRLASTSPSQTQSDAQRERGPKCRCNFRRDSSSEVLDEEGRALFNILEFPSKVHACIHMYTCV